MNTYTTQVHFIFRPEVLLLAFSWHKNGGSERIRMSLAVLAPFEPLGTKMAEATGFEPAKPLRAYTLSKRAP